MSLGEDGVSPSPLDAATLADTLEAAVGFAEELPAASEQILDRTQGIAAARQTRLALALLVGDALNDWLPAPARVFERT